MNSTISFELFFNKFLKRNGFTVIELLVAISVVLVLLTILIASLSGTRKSADNAACVSNLRGIGSSIQLYQVANNGKLPGPVWISVWNIHEMPGYDAMSVASQRRNLGFLLKDYGADPTLFTCPSAFRKVGWNHSHYRRQRWVLLDGINTDPFGYPGQSSPISIFVDLDPFPLLEDFDQLNQGGIESPKLPVHGTFRNTLFSDGSVRAIDVAP